MNSAPYPLPTYPFPADATLPYLACVPNPAAHVSPHARHVCGTHFFYSHTPSTLIHAQPRDPASTQ